LLLTAAVFVGANDSMAKHEQATRREAVKGIFYVLWAGRQ
jgi:hypothetical protein